jgi:hypothetical protein
MIENKWGVRGVPANLINIPFAIIIASFIIIIVTTNMTDANGLKALIGGYSGLFFGMFFTMLYFLLYDKTVSYLDMFPILMVIVVVGLLIYYLSIYFDRISAGEVSDYYLSFSIISTIFLGIQTVIIFSAIYNRSLGNKLFTDITFSSLGLVSVINIITIITIGIILHFYSTQG